MTKLHIIDRPTEGGYWVRAALPAGSMWREPDHDTNDRECWCIVLPNMAGLWKTTDLSNEQRMWDVTGKAPAITVTPSINAELHFVDLPIGGWHGFITNGEMT